MTESYKVQSKIATAVSFIAAIIVYIGKDELAKLLPVEWASITPIIVLIAGYIATQKTENIRVATAEQMVHDEYISTADSEAQVLNDEYEVDEYAEQ